MDFILELYGLFDKLAAERAAMLPLEKRLPFATIKVGTYPNGAIRQALLDAGRKIGDYGGDILGKVVVVSEPGEANLVTASNAELGYPNGCTRERTYEAGLKRGWELCSAEDAAQYLLQHGDELALNEWFLFAMEPITDSYGALKVFYVARDGDGLWLDGHGGHPGYVWPGDTRWAFRRK